MYFSLFWRLGIWGQDASLAGPWWGPSSGWEMSNFFLASIFSLSCSVCQAFFKNWRTDDLQYCASFRYIAKWLRYIYLVSHSREGANCLSGCLSAHLISSPSPRPHLPVGRGVRASAQIWGESKHSVHRTSIAPKGWMWLGHIFNFKTRDKKYSFQHRLWIIHPAAPGHENYSEIAFCV